uniref:Uncharacterized protein n=1 Tax=Canis lupus familiaris TaxID=9615 RepID=A0A8C0SQF8_CANLF
YIRLPAWSLLLPLPVSLSLLFYFRFSMEQKFPKWCSSSLCLAFFPLFLPVVIPRSVYFHLFMWVNTKLFIHN